MGRWEEEEKDDGGGRVCSLFANALVKKSRGEQRLDALLASLDAENLAS